MARDLLHDRNRALDHERDRVGVERTPWHAAQGAAREALKKAESVATL